MEDCSRKWGRYPSLARSDTQNQEDDQKVSLEVARPHALIIQLFDPFQCPDPIDIIPGRSSSELDGQHGVPTVATGATIFKNTNGVENKNATITCFGSVQFSTGN